MNSIQLYSLATPNGQKVGIALEEMSIPYDAHVVDIGEKEQFRDAFIAINPNSKIPAIVDPEGDMGRPLPIMESAAILIYLAEKSGKFLDQDPTLRIETLQWLIWQVAGMGPMFGQFGHFTVYADDPRDLSYGEERYEKETKRLLAVLDMRLKGRKYLVGDEISIADFACLPWVACLDTFYGAAERLELHRYREISRWSKALLARPGVQKGMLVCKKPES